MKSITDYFFSFLFTKYFQWNNDSKYGIDNSIINFSSIMPSVKALNSFFSFSKLNISTEPKAIDSLSISFPNDIYNESIIIHCSLCDFDIKSQGDTNDSVFISQSESKLPKIKFDSKPELNNQISALEWETLQNKIETKLLIAIDKIHFDILSLYSEQISLDLIQINHSLIPTVDESNRESFSSKLTGLCDICKLAPTTEDIKQYTNVLKDAKFDVIYGNSNHPHRNKIQIACNEVVLDDSSEDIDLLSKKCYSVFNTIQSAFALEISIKSMKVNKTLNQGNISITVTDLIYIKDNDLFSTHSIKFNKIIIVLTQKAFESKIQLSLKQISINAYRLFVKEINQHTNKKQKITSESFTISISKNENENETACLSINILTLSLSFDLFQFLLSLFKDISLSMTKSELSSASSFLLLLSSYSFSLTIPVIVIHIGKRLQCVDKSLFLSSFDFQIDSFSYKYTPYPSLNTTITAILTVKAINPLFETIEKMISNMGLLYEHSPSKDNKHIFNVTNCSIMNINAFVINSIDNALHNQLAFHSTIQNNTSNVFEVSFFNASFSFFLPPGAKSNIIHRLIKIKLSINDNEYEAIIDISKLFKNYFNRELYQSKENKGNSNTNSEVVYYTQIELKSDKQQRKRLTLMYVVNKANLLSLHLIIFDLLIVIRKFPTFNLLSYIIAKSNEITSIERSPDSSNGIIVELKQNDNEIFLSQSPSQSPSQSQSLQPCICFESDNALFCNYFLQEIDITIDYSSNNKSFHIQGRNELSASVNFAKVHSIKLSIKYNNVLYSSDNILQSLSTTNLIQKTALFSYSTKREQSSLSINLIVEDFLSSHLISGVIKQENYSKYTMKIIKLLPHIMLRNYTSCKGFLFSFIHNSSCSLINQKTISLIDINSNDKIESNNLLVELNKNSSYITNKESTFILNDKSNGVFALNRIMFIIKFNSVDALYFSDAIQITKSDKDILFPIEICPNYYFFFRMRARYINDGILSLTLSSFLNINRKGDIREIFIKNKIELPLFERYSNTNNSISEDADEMSYDTIYKVDDRLKEIDLNDVFAFYAFMKKIENTLEILINKEYYSPLLLIDLYTKDNYQICCYYQGKDNEDAHNLNQMSKVYHIRMLHNPLLICEVYDMFVNNSRHWYLYIDNQLEKQKEGNGGASVYYHTESSKEILNMPLKKGNYEMNIRDKIRTLIVTINSKDYAIIKDNMIINDPLVKENEITMTYETQMNTYRIVIKGNNSKTNCCLINNGESESKNKSFAFSFSKIIIQINILPFFIYSNAKSKTNYDFVLSTDKLLMNYIPNQTLNFSFANLFISKGKYQLFSTTYLGDIKIDNIPLYSPSLRLCYLEYRINLPYQMSMTIDDNSIQCLNFFLLQLNSNKKRHTYPLPPSSSSSSSFSPSPRLSILNSISLSPLPRIYMINEIKVNDFSINMNIEYKKGLNFTIKNSTIIHKYVQMKNIIGTSVEIYQNLKTNLMSNFFSNFYSLMSSTEIFGNWKDFIQSVKTGIIKFKERPFTFGIINLVYDSFKGGVNSFVGIGKSVAKTLRHIQSGNYNFEIYNQFNTLVNKNKDSNEIRLSELSTLALSYDVIQSSLGEEYKVSHCCFVEYNKSEVLLIDNKLYFILVNMVSPVKFRIDLMFPYFKINDIRIIHNDDKRHVIFFLMENSDKEFILGFKDCFEMNYFYYSILNKFN